MFKIHCAGCGDVGVELCRRCRFALIAAPPLRTDDGVVAAIAFSGTAKQLVAGLKYRNRRRLAAVFAEQLSRTLDVGQVDVITWAPTSASRSAQRGYDQSELVARALAARWRKPCKRLLYRCHGPTQTGRSRSDRLRGPRFDARPMRKALRVLVIDDVVTTGATLAAAKRALMAAGAQCVTLATVAATPGQLPRPASAATVERAAALSSSTSTPNSPRLVAASTFDCTSSKKTLRSARALSLVKAS